MDWTAEFIERHREALKGILAGLVAMVGLGQSAIGDRPSNAPIAHCRLPTAASPAISTAPCSACFGRPNRRRGGWPSRWRRGSSLPPARARSAPPKPRPSLIVRDGVGTGILWTPGRPAPLARPAPPKNPRRAGLPCRCSIRCRAGAARPAAGAASVPRISLLRCRRRSRKSRHGGRRCPTIRSMPAG